jgi:pilus assembly protein CpaC
MIIDIDKPTKDMKFVTSDDKVLDIQPFKEDKLYIRGKELGYGTLTVYDKTNGKTVAKLDVVVKPLSTVSDLTNLKRAFAKSFPGQDINVEDTQKGIVLYGTVSGAEVAEQALRLADGYLSSLSGGVMTSDREIITLQGGQTVIKDTSEITATGRSGKKIINLLKIGGPQQVLLEVKFAEVNRSSTRELEAGIGLGGLGSDFGGAISSSGGVVSPITNPFQQVMERIINPITGAVTEQPVLVNGLPIFRGVNSTTVGGRVGVLEGGTLPGVNGVPGSLYMNLNRGANVFVNINNFTLMLRFLEEERLGRVLAEPKLITMSGQEASFLAGGEFPFQTVDKDGQPKTEFKDFGVGLRFTPIVGSDGMITLKVAPSVSDLVDTFNVVGGPPVPVFSTRKLESMVQLRDGQTLALAGLLQDNLNEVISKVPLLGDIPILGTLFRSTNYQQKKTDLLIAVTPHLVNPVKEGKLSFPGEFIKPPNRFEFYLEGKLEGRRSAENKSLLSDHVFMTPAAASGGGMEGNFGHMESGK